MVVVLLLRGSKLWWCTLFWLLVIVLSSSASVVRVNAMTSSMVEGDDTNEDEGEQYLYLNQEEVFPVMEFIKEAGNIKGDFRTSVNAKVVEFYNPYCKLTC